ncbi:hypothetical protein [Microlunatus antarcticus]|uniref:Uncharacterized protein n=1 Tax=Microlunatus antarcticus TaxID=53388 RepID=A0A7W5P6G1_9ACTN|nr:hypothetical protein [Microlunatus antarcticus]MBB3326479.1 hypothetical protein [Microlunatus antarcticus]
MSQRERRQNPYPWTWEPAALVTAVLALVVVVGLQAGRSLANGLSVGTWQVAPTETWVATAPGLLAGHAAAGLVPVPDPVASPALLWVVTGLVELVLLANAIYGVRWGWNRGNPWRPRGFADPADIDRILGLHRLRRTAHLIRPDLHGVTPPATQQSAQQADEQVTQESR